MSVAQTFENIPSDLRMPLFYAENDSSQVKQYSNNLRSLIVGQRLAAGSVEAKTPVSVFSADQADEYFGKGSMVARMVRAYRKNDQTTELYVIALDDAAGATKASGEVALSGVATENGTLHVYCGGQRISIPVSLGDTASEIAGVMVTLVSDAAGLPVTASAVSGDVTLAAKNGGTLENSLDLRLNYRGLLGGETVPAGITVALTAMAGGATDPDVGDAIEAMGDEPFEYICQAYTDTTSLDLWDQEMDPISGRWSFIRQLYGQVISARQGTTSELGTFGSARNGKSVSVTGFYDSPSPAYEAAAMICGRAAASLSIDPARPLQTLKLIGFLAPVATSRFVFLESEALLKSGVAVLMYENDTAMIGRMITTYQRNAYGEPDKSWLDIQTLAQTAYFLRSVRQRLKQKYGRHKLADNGTRIGASGRSVTPNMVKAELISVYDDLITKGIVENMAEFKKHLIVERNADDPSRLDMLLPPDYVNGLRVFAVLNQFRLQY